MLELHFFGWIIIGGLAGSVASKIRHTDEQQGILANIIVGVIGGLIGGKFLSFFGFDVANGGLFFSFFTCLLGAVIFLGILQKFFLNKN
ncbi:GlsB/YeaQ/YmgE family stress response membrane protein [Corynebacterium sp. HS2168-gen11]|uniref:GlsB/YeaQ/YmgE family stress response membrane protein n=1 Tax=Corynebacterium sp. HS2168-gen11 TaxID=2974027 RepID=UPI00216B4956|nr:GlsB/YeaQ/YmgE family stress response membrane protein [Corynebacterium sp. HS2168-gen11]MCS4536480.1 GlsB/YeaQ/YmgE family stress response membrane protein [Corynebacterium sp. HS2168-gen11]